MLLRYIPKTNALVNLLSSADGVAGPLGWLCATTKFTTPWVSNKSVTSLMLRSAWFSEPAETFLVKWHKYLKNCVLISFNQSILIRLRKMLPNQKLQLLVSNPMRRVLNFCIKYKVNVSMLWRLVRKDTVRKFNNFGIGVSVWGVKGYNTAIKMIGCGVESITADKIM